VRPEILIPLFAEQATLRKQAVRTDEVANAAAFLLSPRSSGINAQRLVIEGFMQELVERFEDGPIREAMALEIPTVTRTVLDDLDRRLAADPLLSPGAPVPFYAVRGNKVVRRLL
jgi:hypothetical protein